MEYVQKILSGFVSLIKGLIGLILGKGTGEEARKVGKLLAVCFVSICAATTAAAVLKAKKEGRWK